MYTITKDMVDGFAVVYPPPRVWAYAWRCFWIGFGPEAG